MTLEQLRQYKVTKDYNGAETGMAYDIPTLDEFFEYFKKIDDCLIVCEIKTTDQNIVQLFSDKVKSRGDRFRHGYAGAHEGNGRGHSHRLSQ